ncbi:unnamed protein product [Darwinula stevensoni]|uniref:Ciliary BBSome complex subunit 2 C-terminal domain-containing protein n=1 Tax=Darwinula stevensoni TaxID=69355 RepID=A0A7R8X4P8_9CRUS|nr:unnamed protein product [Darwinula stevensoni]CAG0885801.1 unnamed protein product [Darwinula stevensoni]
MGGNGKKAHVELALQTTNDTILRCVMVFGEGVFEGESHVVHPKLRELSSELRVPLFPPRDVPIDLHIKALVGSRTGQHYHVFELTRQLPRFATYAPVDPLSAPEPHGKATFLLHERLPRIAMWLNQTFLFPAEIIASPGQVLEKHFLGLRTSLPLILRIGIDGKAEVLTDDMDIAGDVIQSLASFLNLEDLQVHADFPSEAQKIETLLQKADELQAVRDRLSTDMADNAGIIRTLVIRAEDARILRDWASMKKWYLELAGANRELVNAYTIRYTNSTELSETLKQVNQIVQRAAKLRVGKYKALVVNGCRAAIRDSNTNLLVRVMMNGEA